jgi:O-antigen ligase
LNLNKSKTWGANLTNDNAPCLNRWGATTAPIATNVRPGLLFVVFCLWAFVLLSRPQDIFSGLALLRPALTTGALVLIMIILRYSEMGKISLFKETQIKMYMALFLVMVLGIPFSLFVRKSFTAVVTEYVIVVFFVFAFYKIVDSARKVLTVLLLGSLGTGLYAVFSIMSGSFSSHRLYFGGMFDPNDLAFFSLSFLPFNLIFISRGNPTWKRLACFGSFLAGTLLILLTGSRGGIIGFGVALTMLFFTRTLTMKWSTKVISILLLVIFVTLNYSKIDLSRYETLKDVNEDYNMWDETGRINIWKIGMRAMLANPLTGVGVGCFNEAVGRDRARRGVPTQYWQAPHNMLVQIGAETGVIGLALFMLISLKAYLILRKAWKKGHSKDLVRIGEMGRIAFAGLFISGLFLSQAYSIYWAFFVALSAVVSRLQARGLENEAPTLKKNGPDLYGPDQVKKNPNLRAVLCAV